MSLSEGTFDPPFAETLVFRPCSWISGWATQAKGANQGVDISQLSVQRLFRLSALCLVCYFSPSPAESSFAPLINGTAFLEAISSFIVGTPYEWRLNVPLGLALDRIENGTSHPLDHYATTTISGTFQLVYVRCAGLPAVVMSPQPLEDLQQVDAQIELLADWIASRESEVLDLYIAINGFIGIVDRLVEAIITKLNWASPKLQVTLCPAVLDHSTFIPHPLLASGDVTRPVTSSDDLSRLAVLFQQYRQDSGHDSVPTFEQALEAVTDRVSKGLYWGYFVSGTSLAAAISLQRPTPNVVCVSLVVTATEYRRRGYGGAITSALVAHALKSVEDGGLGKSQVTLFYDVAAGTEKMYKRVGFVDGEKCNLWLFQKPKQV
ncbi:hypothetical protein DL96DRAFT_1609172 [Flagelloscypha sp. PMI_526]|nr:hypothetical protein DL96DRAFT_1609172 [Flagelloscypha sp. PMI_526]